jgi:hypothetical protein
MRQVSARCGANAKPGKSATRGESNYEGADEIDQRKFWPDGVSGLRFMSHRRSPVRTDGITRYTRAAINAAMNNARPTGAPAGLRHECERACDSWARDWDITPGFDNYPKISNH